MEKSGEPSPTPPVTPPPGSPSRPRSAALIPASLPPIATMCMAGLPLVAIYRVVPPAAVTVAGFVRDDDPGGLSRGERGIQHPDEEHPGDAAADLGGDEHRG